jgi:hypothetical protein
MLTLILHASASRKIADALEKAGRREVGGILMGEHIGMNEFAVAELTVHKRGALASFVRRIEEAVDHLSSFFARTEHDYTRFNYIGEWHSHPLFELEPSVRDDVSMMEIVLDPRVGAKFLVLLLVKLDTDGSLLVRGHLYLPDATKERCDVSCRTSVS